MLGESRKILAQTFILLNDLEILKLKNMKKDINYHGLVIVFDLDDTLIRERDYCREGFRRIERKLTRKANVEMSESCKKENFRGIASEMIKILEKRGAYFDYLESRLKAAGRETEMAELVKVYRNNEEAQIKPVEGIKEVLDEFSASGIVMGIISDGRSATQRVKIRRAGLEKYFAPDNIIISEETGKDKTKPDNFRHFVSRYPEAQKFIYIGDNERKDFKIPNLMGWDTFKMKWNEDNVHEEYENSDKMSRPKMKLESAIDILKHISTK